MSTPALIAIAFLAIYCVLLIVFIREVRREDRKWQGRDWQ